MINNKYIELSSVLKAMNSLTKIDGYIRPEEFEAVVKSLPVLTVVDAWVHKTADKLSLKKFEGYEDEVIRRALEELIVYGYNSFPDSFEIEKWEDDRRYLMNYRIKIVIGRLNNGKDT